MIASIFGVISFFNVVISDYVLAGFERMINGDVIQNKFMMGEKDLDLTAELKKILGENNSAVDSLFK